MLWPSLLSSPVTLPSVTLPPPIPEGLSLGAGVQSSTLLFMAAEGLIRPMPVGAFFGDTQEEPDSVYRWFKFLQSLKLPFPIYSSTYGHLGNRNLRVMTSKNTGKRYVPTIIPAFIKNPDGSRGVLSRRCTRDYKIYVVQRTIKKEILKRSRIPSNPGLLFRSWIGISTDEADRMKPSGLEWVENRWPLIELGMSRADCVSWVKTSRFYPAMLAAGFTEPPRSSCKQCPYHSDREWLRLKTEEPEAFAYAVEWEKKYQNLIKTSCELTKGQPFLHSSLIPLDQVTFTPNNNKPWTSDGQFSNECAGMCGV